MRPLLSIDYLLRGSRAQRRAHAVLKRYRVLAALRDFDPLLAGTVPLDVQIESSDLDILCRVRAPDRFLSCFERHFSRADGFRLREVRIDGLVTYIANFTLGGWPLEIFGQNRAPRRQTAYRHLRVERRLLRAHGAWLRRRVVHLKRRGLKTEPAFARALRLKGDPYKMLLRRAYTV